jgi:F420 biosynthesis protein FbiB-like protein
MAQAWVQALEKDGESPAICTASADASVERFANAPVLVVACLTMNDMKQFPDEERQRCEHDLAVQSLSAAIQNLLLTAHAKQLGSCWYCAPIFCKSAVRQALNLPDDVEPQAVITIGYPAEKPNPPPRRPLTETAFLDEWGKGVVNVSFTMQAGKCLES